MHNSQKVKIKFKTNFIRNMQWGLYVGGLDIFLWGIGNYQLGMAYGITGGDLYHSRAEQ